MANLSGIENAYIPAAAVIALAAVTHVATSFITDAILDLQNIPGLDFLPIITTLFTLILVSVIYLKTRLHFVSEDEQLFIEGLTKVEVVNGPQIVLLPFMIKKSKKKKAISLNTLQYVVVKDALTGAKRVEQGPKLLYLGAYDWQDGSIQDVISLKATEYIRFLNKATGGVRVEVGEQGRVVPEANEVLLDSIGKKKAIDLKCFEYVKLECKKTGKIRVEKGEKLVFPDKFEEIVGGSKKQAIEIDEETACLLRNKRTGQQSLETTKGAFMPSNDQEIIEVRKMIKLADYEACIVRGKDGKDKFYFGKNDTDRAFFLPPHSSLVKLLWSRGRRREYRDLEISKIDLRPMYMSFEFNCRTSDNVELILEGSFFWEIRNLVEMVRFTNDTTGDICNHARSRFIEKVSKVTLQAFMADFNKIAEQVHRDDDSNFYSQRGVQIHSLEVTGYRCAEASTARILEQIIQETTNRMNRLQQQESENEVQLFSIKGDIEEERARSDLLKVETENAEIRARTAGMGEAQKVRSFLDDLKAEIPDLNKRIEMWNVLRKEDALSALANGNCNTKLYFTPNDVNLSIENHEHEVENGKSDSSRLYNKV